MPGQGGGGGGGGGTVGGGGGGGTTHTTGGGSSSHTYVKKGKAGKVSGPSGGVDRRGARANGINGITAPIPQKDYTFKSMVGTMHPKI